MRRILITGGRGTLGKAILNLLAKKEFELFVLTSKGDLPNSHNIKFVEGDLTKPESLSKLKNKFDVIVHCASNALDSDAIDINGTQNLLSTIQHDNIEHFIYISIVGVDKSAFKYYQNKFRVERFIKDSGIPYTIIRATQFHDLVLQRIIQPADKGDGSKVVLPKGLRFQTIDTIDVAKKIFEILEKISLNEIITIGGPEILSLDRMVDDYLTLLKRNEVVEFVPPGNDFQTIFTTGINLCPENKYGTITWMDYLNSIY